MGPTEAGRSEEDVPELRSEVDLGVGDAGFDAVGVPWGVDGSA